jgi:hypothetical protein
MGWRGTLRSMQAAARAAERNSRRRQHELARRSQAIAKATAVERATYEVEVFRNRLERLVSIHKEGSAPIEWNHISQKAAPNVPQKLASNEESAHERLASYRPGIIVRLLKRADQARLKLEKEIEEGRSRDEVIFKEECARYEQEHKEWVEQREFADRVTRGDLSAYIEVIEELNPFGEISDIGSGVRFAISNPQTVEADISVRGESAVPRESMTLLKSGKLSVKQMPKGEFYRLYQDYICSCVLRVARELFAILPIENVIVSALEILVDSSTGHLQEQPIISVLVPRKTLMQINLDLVDPSDSMKNFVHRMNFKPTSGFKPVERVSVEEFTRAS